MANGVYGQDGLHALKPAEVVIKLEQENVTTQNLWMVELIALVMEMKQKPVTILSVRYYLLFIILSLFLILQRPHKWWLEFMEQVDL